MCSPAIWIIWCIVIRECTLRRLCALFCWILIFSGISRLSSAVLFYSFQFLSIFTNAFESSFIVTYFIFHFYYEVVIAFIYIFWKQLQHVCIIVFLKGREMSLRLKLFQNLQRDITILLLLLLLLYLNVYVRYMYVHIVHICISIYILFIYLTLYTYTYSNLTYVMFIVPMCAASTITW